MNTLHKIVRHVVAYHERFGFYWARLKCLALGQIKIGRASTIAGKAKLILDGSNPTREYVIEVGERTSIRDYALLCPRTGFIKIGDGCSINPYCVLLGYGGITIGNNVRIASHTTVTAFNHVFSDPDATIYSQGNRALGIVIEDDVWIGAGARILDGITIGQGAVIGANSVVTKDVPPRTVVVGAPARPIKMRTGNDAGA